MFKVPSFASPPGTAAAAAVAASHQSSRAASAIRTSSDGPDLTQAAQAQWIARNVDRIFGGQKRGAVARLIASVCSPEAPPGSDVSRHARSLKSFCALSDLGKPSCAGRFTLAVGNAMLNLADGSRREVLAYRFDIEGTVFADRSFAAEPRESMLQFARQIESLGLWLPPEMAGSWCFHDAQILNRLAHALPDEVGLHAPRALDMLAADIDELNIVPEYVDRPHIAMAAKVLLLADCFPDQRFDIHFRREMGQDNDGYFISVRPKIDQHNPKAIAQEPMELYSATISPDDPHQLLSLLLLAIQQRVVNEEDEHRAIISSNAALIARHRDTMTQDPATRRLLIERGDDPAFHCGNYRFLGVDEMAETFSAAFGEVAMVFSNKPPMMGELRGVRLQEWLLDGRYRTLNELMSTGHKTANDPILRAVMSTLQNDVLPMMLRLDPDTLQILTKQIDWLRVADTTLGALWDPLQWNVAPEAAVHRGKFSFPRAAARTVASAAENEVEHAAASAAANSAASAAENEVEHAAASAAANSAASAAANSAASAATNAATNSAANSAPAAALNAASEVLPAAWHVPLHAAMFSPPRYGRQGEEGDGPENPEAEGMRPGDRQSPYA